MKNTKRGKHHREVSKQCARAPILCVPSSLKCESPSAYLEHLAGPFFDYSGMDFLGYLSQTGFYRKRTYFEESINFSKSASVLNVEKRNKLFCCEKKSVLSGLRLIGLWLKWIFHRDQHGLNLFSIFSPYFKLILIVINMLLIFICEEAYLKELLRIVLLEIILK